MLIGSPFENGDSVLHRVDPRYRLMAATALTLLVAVSRQRDSLLAALAVAVLFVGVARLEPVRVLRRLLVVAGFLGLLWLVLPWAHEGPAMFRIGPVTLTRPGIWLCAQITVKSITILLFLMALLATMPVATLGHALGKCGVSDKLVMLLLITYRYISVIESEYHRLRRSMLIRGFVPRTTLHTYKSIAYLLGMLFVRAAPGMANERRTA